MSVSSRGVSDIQPDPCEALVRAADKDRFLSTLFAPAERRRALFALYAFNVEIASVRERVSAPLPGEVRLQWWRDVLEGRSEGGGHQVATAICGTVSRCRLPVTALLDLIDARTLDLYDDPMRTLDDLVAYGRRTSSALIALAMRILQSAETEHLDAARPLGIAYAIDGLLRALPWHASRGQVLLPEEVLARHGIRREEVLAATVSPGLLDALAELRAEAWRQLAGAREALATLPETLVPAVLPVAVTRLNLDCMKQADYAPFATTLEVPQWRRQWAMWRAARAPGRIAGS